MTGVQFFFQTPKIAPKNGMVSTLHLLRRDIYSCLGKPHDNINAEIQPAAIWPGVMLILTGIDLISKFYCGNDSDNKSKERFKIYVEKYIDSHSEEIYQLRNALLHGFSLYSKHRNKEWRYVLGREANYILTIVPSGIIKVSANQLHLAFENSLNQFFIEYPSLPSFSEFDQLNNKYGWTNI